MVARVFVVVVLLGVCSRRDARAQPVPIDAGLPVEDAPASDAPPAVEPAPTDAPPATEASPSPQASAPAAADIEPAPGLATFREREAVVGWRGYLEPSVFLLMRVDYADEADAQLVNTDFFMRVAAGARIVRYGPGGRSPLHVKIGVTAYIMAVPSADDAVGFGGEIGVDRVLSRTIALGGRLGLEAGAGPRYTALLTLGPRMYFRDVVSLGVDYFRFSGPSTPTGVMLEVGLLGKGATYGTVPLVLLLSLIAFSSS